MNTQTHNHSSLLGDFLPTYESFENLDAIFAEWTKKEFHALSFRKKFKAVNTTLLTLIQSAKEESFLLPATLLFIDRVNKEKVLHEPYKMSSFEFWLNRFSELTEEENLKVRAKIIGKHVPRSSYQSLFPIGMGRVYSGSHFVAAHASPDIDTTIASFWGWMDAFGAKVCEGVHVWSVPGTFQECHFTHLFGQLFSPKVFENLARTTPTLTLSALDLVTQKNVVKVQESTRFSHLEHKDSAAAIVVINENGYYKGDWRSQDAESIGNIMLLFNSLLRWFENAVHAKLIATFAKASIHKSDLHAVILPLLTEKISKSDPAQFFNEEQKKYLHAFLEKVLGVQAGLDATFSDLGLALDPHTKQKFSAFKHSLEQLSDNTLYNESGTLIENRPNIFNHLERVINDLTEAVQITREHIERLDVMLQVKEKVLLHPPMYITLKSDVEEIKSKINDLEHLTVVIPENSGLLYPVGVVFAYDVRKPILGSVSLRDFSNERETQMASYLEVISVIDHHKTELKTQAAPCFLIADVQSSNTLISELAFEVNERYSTFGMDEHAIDKELEAHTHQLTTSKDAKTTERFMRLLQLKRARLQNNGYFVHPGREFAEYLTCLYAILDDTDLLTKVSDRDVLAVAKLLNRMKSLSLGKEVEIINLDHLERDARFAKKAAGVILQDKDMYSIYKKIYEYKEQETEANLAQCIQNKPSTIFADTKEQNGCCRVGQTKIFCSNFDFFKSHADELRLLFVQSAKKVYESKSQVDFHMHMISTIAGADEVFTGNLGNWNHKDEMWIWVPPTEIGIERLTNFLNAFLPTESVQKNSWEVEFLGQNAFELNTIFERNFPIAERKPIGAKAPDGLPIAVLRYKAGSLNSRKAQITPFLPRLVS